MARKFVACLQSFLFVSRNVSCAQLLCMAWHEMEDYYKLVKKNAPTCHALFSVSPYPHHKGVESTSRSVSFFEDDDD